MCFQTGLNQLVACGEQRIQLAAAGAVAAHRQLDLLASQRQLQLATARQRALQPRQLGELGLQLLGNLARHGLALGLQPVELGVACGDPRVLPAALEYRQVEAEFG